MNVLIIIPARGGSKGIPRKNLRLLNGKPLIYYSIKTALSSKYNPDVYVTSDDDEILNISEQFGARTFKRSLDISDDKTTLDPVIYNCFTYIKNVDKKKYDLIITMQATSPLLTTNSLDNAISKMEIDPSIETIISAKDNTHLSWSFKNNQYTPNYKERLNRQYLKPEFTETGGFLITKECILTSSNRIGNKVDLYLLSKGEEIDIDTYQDWNLCEYYLKRKHILFVVTGNDNVGLGHVYNTLLIANDILNHNITFLVDKDSKLALEKINSKNYNVKIQTKSNIIEDIMELSPDIVINDCLDTDYKYVKKLKELNISIINFEDLGEGSKLADLVVNAIYPEKMYMKNHYYGPDYFILRDEFLYCSQKNEVGPVKNILLTFGGVDPNNYTKKVLESIYSYCDELGISINVITGFGYKKDDTLKDFKNINLLSNVTNISKYMLDADLIFTSAGRTTYEIASLGTPAIVLAQNEREMTHFFASSQFGFTNLGLGYNISHELIFNEFKEIISSTEIRKNMNSLMTKTNLKNGRYTVNKLIQEVINNYENS